MMTDNTHNELTLDDLSARREKQGISVADMANRIKVSREIIKYIEQGEFNRIGSATFIRGHVGNYARELGLDLQTVIALVPAQHLKPYEPKLSSSKVSNPLSRVKSQSSGFGRYVLGTFLVAALGLSFYFVYDKWDNNRTDSILQTVEKPAQIPLNNNGNQKKVIYSSLLPQADLVEESDQDNANLPAQDDDGDSDIMTSDFDENDDAGRDVDAVEPDTTVPATVETATADQQFRYHIRFDLSDQAWVSIKTQNGDTVVSDLIGPGERQFSADDPLHFRIGNATQLTLHINDQVVDLSNHTRQDVADFDWPLPEG